MEHEHFLDLWVRLHQKIAASVSACLAVVGDQSNFNIVFGIGGGTANFSTPTPLIVSVNLYNGSSGPALPVLEATLRTFELEY